MLAFGKFSDKKQLVCGASLSVSFHPYLYTTVSIKKTKKNHPTYLLNLKIQSGYTKQGIF